MQINATVFVQMINFFITYKVLTTFLFGPVIASLKKKKEDRDKLAVSIEKEEEKLLSLEKEKTHEVILFQDHVKKEYPFPSLHFEKPLEIPVLREEAIDTKALEKKITQWLTKEVPHGY